jgi:predicted  nucleic acid-binding Zn-ribbon protein
MLSKDTLQKLLDELRQQRDELKLKLHLAKADARDEFAELEKKFEHLRSRLEAAGAEAGDVAGNVGTALAGVAEELRKGYERIRQHF